MACHPLPVILIGAGGHAKVLIDILTLDKVKILGAIDADPAKAGAFIGEVKISHDENLIKSQDPEAVLLVNAVGSIKGTSVRKRIFQEYKALGYRFHTLIHPSAIVSSEVQFEEGTQIMAGVIIQPGTRIDHNTIVNTGASIDHDCQIGAHVHLAPRVTLCGGVTIEDDCHIATASTIIQGVTVGKGSLIGATSLVLKNVAENSTLFGCPAQ